MKNRQEIEREIRNKATDDESFRKQLTEDPKTAISGLLADGVEIPDEIEINVIEESPTSLTLVLPPETNSELSAHELDSVSGGYDWDWGGSDYDRNHP